MLLIDQFAYQSRWRNRDPRAKFGLYLLLMIVALTSSPMIQCFELLGTGVLTCHLLRISVARYLRWMLVPLVFLLVGLVGILISVSTQSDNMLWHIQLGSLAIGIDKVGLYTAHMTLWRSLATLAATYLFVLTTPFTQMIRLLQMSRLPKVLIEQMLLTYRFIFILLEEAAAIRKAQSLRFGYRNLRTSFQSLAMLIGMLLQRVIYRYQQMEIALEMKLFQGEFYS